MIAPSVAVLGTLVLTCGVVSCGRKAPAADVAAELDGQPVPYAEFEVYLASNAIVEAPSLDSQVLSGLFDQFLEELMLTRLAEDEGIEVGTTRVAVAQLVSEAGGPVARSEVEAFYHANPDSFRQAESVRLRQILVEERATAEQAARELAAGEPFEVVAQRHSQGPRAGTGGDQGVLTRADLPPEIAAQIFEIPAGETSAVISAEYGYHIFQVSERHPEALIPFAEAAPRIVEVLEERKRSQTTATLLDRAAKRYNIRLYERNLPFRYLGKYG